MGPGRQALLHDDRSLIALLAYLKAQQQNGTVQRACRKGRAHFFIEITMLVDPMFKPQGVHGLDVLSKRIWAAIGLPMKQAWLGILFTADPRWSWAGFGMVLAG